MSNSTLEIIRLTKDSEDAQFGGVLINGQLRFVSLELPWDENMAFQSCIPEGTYKCKKETHSIVDGFETFRVLDVPGRAGILFHWGNVPKHTRGCILIGDSLGLVGMEPAILHSKTAFRRFMTYFYQQDEVNLVLRRA